MYGARSPLLKLLVFLAVLAAAVLFARIKKDALVREGSNFLQTLLSRETKLDVRIGKISGRITGVIRFEDLVLEDPNLPEGLRVLLRAKQIEFRYRPWEFLTKNFRAKIDVYVAEPELTWRSSMKPGKDLFPIFRTFRDILLAERQRLSLHIQNMTLFLGSENRAFPGISLDYDERNFNVSLPLRHYPMGEHDISTEFKIEGRFENAAGQDADTIAVRLHTEGSVVNAQPLPWESTFDMELTRERLRFKDSAFLGGFQMTGDVTFGEAPAVDIQLNAKEYPLKNLEMFLGRGESNSYDGQLTLEAKFRGSLTEPGADVNARIDGGKFGTGHYQSMMLHASGVYPTVTISDSHLLTEDNVQMQFADQTVEFNQLFSTQTYRELITGRAQDNVSLGGWGFKRPFDENQKPEFLMERSLGQNARVLLRKYNETEQDRRLLQPSEERDRQDVEVGFELHLRPEDKLKYTMREDEQFVGVERKMSF